MGGTTGKSTTACSFTRGAVHDSVYCSALHSITAKTAMSSRSQKPRNAEFLHLASHPKKRNCEVGKTIDFKWAKCAAAVLPWDAIPSILCPAPALQQSLDFSTSSTRRAFVGWWRRHSPPSVRWAALFYNRSMEQYGNTTTFNIESVLHKNIKDGEYFNKTCVKLTTFEELVDEVRLGFRSLPDV